MIRQVSVVPQSKVDTANVSEILDLNLDKIPSISTRTVKVFLSSNFSGKYTLCDSIYNLVLHIGKFKDIR